MIQENETLKRNISDITKHCMGDFFRIRKNGKMETFHCTRPEFFLYLSPDQVGGGALNLHTKLKMFHTHTYLKTYDCGWGHLNL
jgi:hypothetical protein